MEFHNNRRPENKKGTADYRSVKFTRKRKLTKALFLPGTSTVLPTELILTFYCYNYFLN